MVGLGILAFFVFVAIFAPFLEPYDPTAKTGPVYEPPSSAHWLGTDDGGGDMLSLLIAGSRVSLGVGFVAALVAILIGGTVGVLSGFFGGTTDTVLMRFTDYMLVIPDIPLMIIAAALFGRNLINIIVIIGIIYWTSTARLIRAQVKSVRERVYVKRAQALGAGNRRLVFKHVLPQVTPLLDREHRPDDRARHLRRDVHHVSRPRRPEHDLVGTADRERVHRARRRSTTPGGRSCRPGCASPS